MRETQLWAGLPEPDSLTSAVAKHIVSAIVSGDPSRADELANLLLSLERELAGCQDPSVDAVVEQIDKLVEIAFQQSEPYYDYLDVYRITVHQRCRRTPCSARPLREDAGFQDLVLMVFRHGKRSGKPN
jgi:hypothetical protein